MTDALDMWLFQVRLRLSSFSKMAQSSCYGLGLGLMEICGKKDTAQCLNRLLPTRYKLLSMIIF